MTVQSSGMPLSFAQERLWFLQRLRPTSSAYNVVMALRIRGVLATGVLERALGEVVRRHEILRARVWECDGGPVQAVIPFTGMVLPLEDMAHLDGEVREREVRRQIDAEMARAHDLALDPPFRARLLRLDIKEHLLLLAMHHSATDGWSRNVLLGELSALYGAYRDGLPSPLPPLPLQYGDYAHWHRERMRGELMEAQLNYWRRQLAEVPTLLTLAADHPRPAVPTLKAGQEQLNLSTSLVLRLRALCRAEGVTPFMALLAAFDVILSKYSASDDIVVGTPMTVRTHKDAEPLIGLFVNEVPLRVDLRGNPTFSELLQRVRTVTLDAYRHRELPFDKLVAELRPERSLSRSPVFQVMLSLLPGREASLELAGLEVEQLPVEPRATDFDLSLAVALGEQGLRAVLTYSADLFDPRTPRRMLRRLGALLERVTDDANARVSELAKLEDDERHQILEAWNRTAMAVPVGCLHELVARRVARMPDAIALVGEDEAVSYSELDLRTDRLARHLFDLGVGPEVRVGIAMERGFDSTIAILAVLKAGGAYVPLAPSLPPERLGFMAADAGVAVILAGEELHPGAMAGRDIPVVAVNRRARMTGRAHKPPPARVTADNLCYVIYTSGSSGRPRGVMVTHRNVVNLLAWACGAFAVDTDSVFAQVTTTSFDISVLELFVPLIAGARVAIVADAGRRDMRYLTSRLAQEQATLMQTTPSTWRLLTEDGWRARRGFRALSGGEAMAVDLAATLVEADGEVWNLYGPTETTIWSCAWRVTPPFEGRVPIGWPLANTRAYVLDNRGEPVPAGVSGELHLGGAGVTRGYLGRPRLTADRFMPDPFGPPGSRLYRTGDLARWSNEGTLEFIGRSDGQVKLRGFRVELGEIETALRAYEGVRDARAVVRADAHGESHLLAYIVGNVQVETLSEYLRSTLPDYMVPSAFVGVDALPLTPSGKLDAAALPAPELSGGNGRYVAPGNETEALLAKLWSETLGLERVSVTDNFFTLGGHSLAAMRVVSRIDDACGVRLPLRVLFERPTIRELAGALSLR